MTTTKAALVVVDVQRDFCPGGALAVKDGDEIVSGINRLTEAFVSAGLPVYFTRDWHPRDHCSFKGQGGIWPPHCIRGTAGAKFAPGLLVPPESVVISKGTKPDQEAYSGFQGTRLAEMMNDAGVTEVFAVGLATDYCVKNTVLDALSAGFRVSVIEDCVKGVNRSPKNSEEALRYMRMEGASLISSGRALKEIRRAAV